MHRKRILSLETNNCSWQTEEFKVQKNKLTEIFRTVTDFNKKCKVAVLGETHIMDDEAKMI